MTEDTRDTDATTDRVKFNVNGRDHYMMDFETRLAQINAIKERAVEVNQYLLQLNDEDDWVRSLIKCMDPDTGFEFWCDRYCWTFDPRDKKTPSKRFILYECQREAAERIITCIREGRDIHLDKSRDMGASWLMMAIVTWMWLFEKSFHAHVGSRVERLVDDYTVDSLFGKIDYIIERLPHWMCEGYSPTSHRRQLKIQSPRGNLITGESANKNFGRGPRKNLVYLDEFAFWDHDRSVWTSVADTAPCRVATSTPCGEGNEFARLKFDENEDIERITLHWTAHPYKNLQWYSNEKLSRTDIAVAQELDINYRASAGGIAITSLSDSKRRNSIVTDPVSVDHASNEGCVFHMGLDYGTTNPSSIHVYRVRPVSETRYEVFSLWEYYEPSNLHKISEAIKNCPWRGLVSNIYADPSMWYYNQNDPHGQRGVTSLAFLLQDLYGIHITPGRRGDAYALEQLNEMTRDAEHIRFKISRECENQIREFENLRFETISDKLSHKRNTPEKLVDKDNHSWDDFKYFFNSYFEKPQFVSTPRDDVPLGYEALKQEIKDLKSKKLSALNKPNKLQRRLFRYR